MVSIERTGYDSSNDPSAGFQKQHISASDHLLFNTNKRNVYSATQLEMFNLFCRYVCTAKRIFQWRRSRFYRERYDLTAYTADANALIRFISDLFPHMNEAWNRSENIGIRAIFFPCLHCRGPCPICATWEEKHWNWVTWTMQCKCGLKARTHRDKFRARYLQTFNASWLNKGRQCECAHRREKRHA